MIEKGKRTKHKLALIHEKIANQRKDFLHKLSTQLVKNHDSIAVENLNITEMLQNHCLAQSIQDSGWGMFVDFCKYKADWYGKNVLQIGRFEPSTKMCNICGTINNDLTLDNREWTCCKCHTHHDRDENAALNIKNFALRNYLCKELTFKNRNELPTLVGVLTYEATNVKL